MNIKFNKPTRFAEEKFNCYEIHVNVVPRNAIAQRRFDYCTYTGDRGIDSYFYDDFFFRVHVLNFMSFWWQIDLLLTFTPVQGFASYAVIFHYCRPNSKEEQVHEDRATKAISSGINVQGFVLSRSCGYFFHSYNSSVVQVLDAVFPALTRERTFDLSHPLSLSEVGTWPGTEWIPGRSVGNFAFPWRLRT